MAGRTIRSSNHIWRTGWSSSTNSHPHSHANAAPNSDATPNTAANTHSHADSYSHPNANTATNTHSHADSNANPHTDSYSYSHTATTDSHSHADADSYTNSYPHAAADTMTELEKYQGIYTSPEKFPKYGHSNHGSGALRLLAKWKPTSLLDVGCGWNEFVRQVRGTIPGLPATGIDFACPGADVIATADHLPLLDKEVDVLTAFDVMEHIAPADVDTVLAEMARVSQRFIFSISYVSSVNKWRGETLHPTVRPESWWMTRLVRAGAVAITKQGRYLTGQWKSPLRITPGARVILVGNGPSVLTADFGVAIDAHDEVVRFNNYAIEGFEKHVGRKTTLWSTFFKRIGDEKIPHPRVLCPHEADKPPAECTEVYHIASVYYNRVRDDVQRRAAWVSGFHRDIDPLLASSGILVVCWLLECVGVEKLSLIGFDHFSKVKSGLHHYWLNQAFKKPPEHDGTVEAQLFQELREAGRIEYLA